jgi:hypothetical protein
MRSSIPIFIALLVVLLNPVVAKVPRKCCRVSSGGSNLTDDTPSILKAFKKCGRNGRVIFAPTTYYINSIMNISWLEDVDIDIYGKLLVESSLFMA